MSMSHLVPLRLLAAAILFAATGLAAAPAQAVDLDPGMPDFPSGFLPPDAGVSFERLQDRLDAAPGVRWQVERDLVVPALPDYDHLLGELPGVPAPAVSGASVRAVSGAPLTLGAALLSATASGSGLTLEALVDLDPAWSSRTLGVSPLQLGSLDLTDLTSLSASLAGLRAGASSPGALLEGLTGAGVDGEVSSAAAALAAGSWALNFPGTPQVVPPEVDAAALGFGLLTRGSLAEMAAGFPELALGIEGLGTPEGQAAWESSMAAAFDAVQVEMTSTLPSPCLAGMLQVAASGRPEDASAFAGCDGDCQASGMYLNRRLVGLWAPSAMSPSPVEDGVVSAAELDRLPGWLAAPIQSQLAEVEPVSPELPVAPDMGAFSGGCGTSGAAAGAVSRTLPDVLSALRE